MKIAQTSIKIWAVVPASGTGSRFSKTTLKQYQRILNKTILEHSIERLFELPLAGCVLAVNANDKQIHQLDLKPKGKIHLCHGGVERVYSVLNALNYLLEFANPNDYVLVHDAARPCVHIDQLNLLVNTAINNNSSAILAVPVRDTLKQVVGVSTICQTVDRALLWQAQTPQIARIAVLKKAIEMALNHQINITDESSALECLGEKVEVVQGRTDNIKITYPEDLLLAELILKSQESI